MSIAAQNGMVPRAAARIALGLFVAHLALIAFSTVAMLTVLNGPPGPWLNTEPAATVMRLAWRFSGPLYVTLGALAALAFLWGRLGASRSLALFVVATLISLGMELLGTTTALPFGEYHYSALLGYRIAGEVPFPIPLSWFYMLVGCLTAVARRSAPHDHGRGRWRWAIVAAVLLVAWDVSMDPAMVRTGHWAWGTGQMFRDHGLPAYLVAFFTAPTFYGMPLSNWLGWFLTAAMIARIMLAIVPPTDVVNRLAPSRFPLVLYLVNGIMPVALCVRDRLWGAAALGAAAMVVAMGPALWSSGPRAASRRATADPPPLPA